MAFQSNRGSCHGTVLSCQSHVSLCCSNVQPDDAQPCNVSCNFCGFPLHFNFIMLQAKHTLKHGVVGSMRITDAALSTAPHYSTSRAAPVVQKHVLQQDFTSVTSRSLGLYVLLGQDAALLAQYCCCVTQCGTCRTYHCMATTACQLIGSKVLLNVHSVWLQCTKCLRAQLSGMSPLVPLSGWSPVHWATQGLEGLHQALGRS